jgi:uncharacterized protein YceK
MKRLSAILLVASLSGCGTVLNCVVTGAEIPYGGVVGDGYLIGYGVQHSAEVPIWPLAFLDMPFCVVADTVTLPYTAARLLEGSPE